MNIQKIKEKFKKVLEDSQQISLSDEYIDYLFEKWYENKKDFIEVFSYYNEKSPFIYELPQEFNFEVNLSFKQANYNAFCEEIENAFLNSANLISFLQACEVEDFYKNSLSKDISINDIRIKKGSKILKALKHFIENPKILELVQNRASQLIQRGKGSGTFCVSVHPLDYLSASENSYNWRSCHSLDGDYRAGNLAYMMDSSTLICYIKSSSGDTTISRFGSVKWNTKKWRMLLFMSENRDCMFAGRQYPFNVEGILDNITSMSIFEDISKKNKDYWSYRAQWANWSNTQIRNSFSINSETITLNKTYVIIDGQFQDINKIIQHNGVHQPVYYNDLLYSSCYIPYYTYNKSVLLDSDDIKFKIGADVPCANCDQFLNTGNSLYCLDCIDEEGDNDYYYCENCGSTIYYDDVTFVDGLALCPHCVDTVTTECEECGERVFNDNIIYDEDKEKFICKWCGGQE